MCPTASTDLAAKTSASVKNVVFAQVPQIVPRKIAIIGVYNPAYTIADNVPVRILSAEEAGAVYGFGYQIHRLAKEVFLGSQGIETWVIPQSETGTAALGSIDFTGSNITTAGTLYLYISGQLVTGINLEAAEVAAAIATKCANAINALANKDLPITAAANGDAVDLAAKNEGLYGNDISIKFNLNPGEVSPAGLVIVGTPAMAGGAGTPDIQTALDGLGTGSNANEIYITDLIHGYGQDVSTLDKISNYVGAGNEFIGLYAKTVARPFRALTGDVSPGSAGLNALISLTDTRKLDRANGVFAVPGSPNHPSEIAAQVIGHMARINNNLAEQNYIDIPLINIFAGSISDNWTSEYENRDLAVKSGISPSFLQNNVITIQDMVTFYRPDSVQITSNGYRSMRNISIIQNILTNIKAGFNQEKWKGISIVQDVLKVTNFESRKKARDTIAVRNELIGYANAFAARAWLFTAEFTIEKLKDPNAVKIRDAGNGFDTIFSIILSGEGGIIDVTIEFDISIAILSL